MCVCVWVCGFVLCCVVLCCVVLCCVVLWCGVVSCGVVWWYVWYACTKLWHFLRVLDVFSGVKWCSSWRTKWDWPSTKMGPVAFELSSTISIGYSKTGLWTNPRQATTADVCSSDISCQSACCGSALCRQQIEMIYDRMESICDLFSFWSPPSTPGACGYEAYNVGGAQTATHPLKHPGGGMVKPLAYQPGG